MKYSQLSIEKKLYVKLVVGLFRLFCINITWHYGNLNVFSYDTQKYIFKISEKTQFEVKTVFNQKIEAETFRNL